MASHSRDPHLRTARPTRSTRFPRLTRSTMSRAACTLALASAASVSLFGETGQAEPRLTPEQVKAQVDVLYRQAEQATDQYDGAKEQADKARSAVEDLQNELARKTARLNTARDTVGSLAAAQYRSGTIDATLQLALNSSPGTYLERVSLVDRLGDRQAQALDRLTAEQRSIAKTRAQAKGKLAALRTAQDRLAAHKQAVQTKLSQARALLAQLTAAQRAAFDASDASDDAASPAAAPAAAVADTTRSTTRPPLSAAPAPSARAAAAVAFAYRALGLPYVWGATGPSSFDCSGLTQAAWRAAGVSLPRTTYTQINAGTRVSESQLRPGDLVFFYSGISHVGLYIGNGQMIHAPHPGAAVRIAPISEMPFAGATRPS
ncbi:Cell wall-associated hydrolase, NlpC family [Streptomyces sp. DvalAA-14]|uniref:C40 family peptidase n=2 Tax=unclassified Streptomyces TaxID=2593676 RepID=UPI00081B36C8|nr:NlpC/P60 family protein [Streptomyces sp. SID4948]SCD43664.1 Cell wall-associated hydrolase, NlpC family [Streptomyces sp. DvalAA-14]